MVGVKPEIVGAFALPTVKDFALVAEPPGAVTEMVPVVAPEGTVTTSWVAVADATVATVPLNFTVSWLGVVLYPVPLMVTVDPTGPRFGLNSMRETVEEA